MSAQEKRKWRVCGICLQGDHRACTGLYKEIATYYVPCECQTCENRRNLPISPRGDYAGVQGW